MRRRRSVAETLRERLEYQLTDRFERIEDAVAAHRHGLEVCRALDPFAGRDLLDEALLGPEGPLMRAMVQKTSDAGFSAPLFVQEMAGYLLDEKIGEQLHAVNAGYRRKALAVRKGIEENLGSFLEHCRGGLAGFYFYLTLRDVETHTNSAFFRFLARTTGDAAADRDGGVLRPRVIYIPGEYCVHAGGDLAALGARQLRISYGFEDTERILVGLRCMRQAIDFAREARTCVSAVP